MKQNAGKCSVQSKGNYNTPSKGSLCTLQKPLDQSNSIFQDSDSNDEDVANQGLKKTKKIQKPSKYGQNVQKRGARNNLKAQKNKQARIKTSADSKKQKQDCQESGGQQSKINDDIDQFPNIKLEMPQQAKQFFQLLKYGQKIDALFLMHFDDPIFESLRQHQMQSDQESDMIDQELEKQLQQCSWDNQSYYNQQHSVISQPIPEDSQEEDDLEPQIHRKSKSVASRNIEVSINVNKDSLQKQLKNFDGDDDLDKRKLKQILNQKQLQILPKYDFLQELKRSYFLMSVFAKQLSPSDLALHNSFKDKLQLAKPIVFQQTKLKLAQQFDRQMNNPERSSASDFHVCFICLHIFRNGQKLGGHTSRSHPGIAQIYEIKKTINECNNDEKQRNQYFSEVNKLYSCEYGLLPKRIALKDDSESEQQSKDGEQSQNQPEQEDVQEQDQQFVQQSQMLE